MGHFLIPYPTISNQTIIDVSNHHIYISIITPALFVDTSHQFTPKMGKTSTSANKHPTSLQKKCGQDSILPQMLHFSHIVIFKQKQALVHLLKIKVHQKSKHQHQPQKKFPELQRGLKPFKWEGAEEMEGGRKGRSLDLWCPGKFTHSWAMLTGIIYFV